MQMLILLIACKCRKAQSIKTVLVLRRKTEGTLGRLIKRGGKLRFEMCRRRGLIYFNKLAVINNAYCVPHFFTFTYK
jgi:hypothetical protein